LPRPPLCPVQDLKSFFCKVFHVSSIVCCLQLMEGSVCFSQQIPCGLKQPLQQVLYHVEVPSSRLSFSSCCFLNLPYFKVQCMQWLSITSALTLSSGQLSRSPMPQMFKYSSVF
jgi:hypothetical protein